MCRLRRKHQSEYQQTRHADRRHLLAGCDRAAVRQIMADCTGLTVAVPETPEPVLLGSAMLASVASMWTGATGATPPNGSVRP